VVQYDNPFAYSDPSTNAAVETLNGVIRTEAGQYRDRVVDAFTPFNLALPQPQTLCTLTLFCTPLQDVHPSDAGYRLVAQLFWAASGYNH
jgi:hypothetical protein